MLQRKARYICYRRHKCWTGKHACNSATRRCGKRYRSNEVLIHVLYVLVHFLHLRFLTCRPAHGSPSLHGLRRLLALRTANGFYLISWVRTSWCIPCYSCIICHICFACWNPMATRRKGRMGYQISRFVGKNYGTIYGDAQNWGRLKNHTPFGKVGQPSSAYAALGMNWQKNLGTSFGKRCQFHLKH